MDNSINILLAIHHKILRDGIKMILEDGPGISVTDSIKDLEDIYELLSEDTFDILVLDLDMCISAVSQTLQRLTEQHSQLKILALTDSEEPARVKLALKSGAAGYMLKKRGKEELIKAIRVISDGSQYLCDDTIRMLLDNKDKSPSQTDEGSKLTEREHEVLSLICKEYTNKEIADILNISVRTVDAHRRNLLQKTMAKNTAGLVKFAIKHNIFHL